jgi:hypothetical protein
MQAARLMDGPTYGAWHVRRMEDQWLDAPRHRKWRPLPSVMPHALAAIDNVTHTSQ